MNIEQLLRECDRLASRYYRLDSGSRERAARDWMQLVRETALKIEQSRFKKTQNEQITPRCFKNTTP
jgi:hypothetical protein